jgi:hypothetical protein
MSNEIKQAAERVRKALSQHPWSDSHELLTPFTVDCGILAGAYLAQHPSDGDEAVTEEWLRSIGFDCCAHWGALDIGDRSNCAAEWDHGKWCVKGINGDFNVSIPIHAPTTRRAVKQLLQALGISTTESE